MDGRDREGNRAGLSAIPLLALALLVGCEAPVTSTPGPSVSVEPIGRLEPVIAAVEPPTGKVGDRVTITGNFYKSAGNPSIFVTFNGYDAENIELVDPHTIRATIPGSGTTGFLVVSVGAYRGNGTWYVVRSGEAPATPSADPDDDSQG